MAYKYVIDLSDIHQFTGTLSASYQVAQTLSGDLSGTTASATVIALQGYPVSSTPPTTGYVLEWNGSTWSPANVAGGGGVTWSDDLAGSD